MAGEFGGVRVAGGLDHVEEAGGGEDDGKRADEGLFVLLAFRDVVCIVLAEAVEVVAADFGTSEGASGETLEDFAHMLFVTEVLLFFEEDF